MHHRQEPQAARRLVSLPRNAMLGRASHQFRGAAALQCDDPAVPPLVAQKYGKLEQRPFGTVEPARAHELNRHWPPDPAAPGAVARRYFRNRMASRHFRSN